MYATGLIQRVHVVANSNLNGIHGIRVDIPGAVTPLIFLSPCDGFVLLVIEQFKGDGPSEWPCR